MEVWIYIAVLIIYALFSAFRKAEKGPESDQEGKNNTPETMAREIVIHKKGNNQQYPLPAEYEGERGSYPVRSLEKVSRENEGRSAENMSLEEFKRTRSQSMKTEMERIKENHYNEESLVEEYQRTHQQGSTIKHHKHSSPETSKAPSAGKSKKIKAASAKKATPSAAAELAQRQVKVSRVRKLLKHNDDLRKAWLVALLLERKQD